jgi:coenzyme PQQ precursor peptide PqqA
MEGIACETGHAGQVAKRLLSARGRHTAKSQEVHIMKKTWTRPVVAERPAGMEVTAYLPAEL